MRKAYEAYKKGEEYQPKHNMEIWALDINIVMTKPIEMPLRIVQPQYHNNDNLCAQKGIFTFWETMYPGMPTKGDNSAFKLQTDRTPLDQQIDKYLKEIKSDEKTYLYRITIPQNVACEIYTYVNKMGYNAATLFPGYDGVARYINERQKIFTE